MSTPEHICLNCKQPVSHTFCGHCGQKNEPAILPFAALVQDVMGHLFHPLDTKLFKTLKLLITKPGYLTNEFLMGRRMSFTAPLRLYLIVSFVYFFVVITILSTIPQVQSNIEAAIILELMPKVTFFMVPVMALLLKLFYSTRLYIEHLVFALHYHTFTFILFTINGPSPFFATPSVDGSISVPVIIFGIISLALQLAVFIYMIFALRNVYKQSTGLTVGKAALIVALYISALTGVLVLITKLLPLT